MTPRLRILTANLWNGKACPDGLAALVRREEVDVACVQEMSFEQADALCDVLPHGCIEPAEDHTGMGIALRHPAKIAWLPMSYRSIRAAILEPKDWPGLSREIAIWNLHLRAPTQWPPHDTVRIRREQLRGVRHYLANEVAPRLVMVGDFNASPVWPVYRAIAALIPDAALEVAQRNGAAPARTWAPWTGENRLRLFRIDHAFARGVDVEDVRRVHLVDSDHDGLIVDVRLG